MHRGLQFTTGEISLSFHLERFLYLRYRVKYIDFFQSRIFNLQQFLGRVCGNNSLSLAIRLNCTISTISPLLGRSREDCRYFLATVGLLEFHQGVSPSMRDFFSILSYIPPSYFLTTAAWRSEKYRWNNKGSSNPFTLSYNHPVPPPPP